MDQSSSSTGDPFGLRRPRRVSAFNNPSVSQQHPVSSPPNRRISPSNDDNSLSFSTSAYPPKPYNSKRLTVDTTSVITEDQDPVTASSIQTTPTSNARSTQRRQQQDRQQQHQQDHQQQHQQQDRHHQHPQQQDRQQHHQQQQQQQTSPPMPGMHPLNLSHISPQHTVLSQLSESPDEPIYIRAPAAAATGRGASYHYNNSVHDNHLDTPTTATTTTDDLNSFRSRRRSTLSVGAAQQRQQLTQKMLVQLQEQMKRTQEELLQTQQETESLTENWQESQRSVAFLQQERDSWRQQYEQLQNAKMTDQEKMRGQLEETQAELEEWQGNLEKEARAVQQKKEQVAKQQQEWMDLQNTVQELETTQQEDQARLLEFDDELHQKQLSLEEVKRRFESNRREQERVLQKQQQDYGARQKHLKDWQQRLEAQVETLEARQREVTRAEEAIRRSNDQLVADLSEIELAHEELERRNASYEAKYILVEQAVEELTAKRQEEEDKVEAAEEWQRELAVQAEQISTDSKVVTQALHEKLSETHKEHNHLLEAIEEKNSELEDLKARVQLFVLEDRKGRQVAIQQAKEAARQLKTIVKEVENAQKQQDVVVQSVTDRTKEYEQLGVRIQKEEDQWEHEKQTMLERQQIHFKTLQNRLMGGITTLTTAATEKHEIVTMELKDRVLKLESLRENLSAVVRKYQRESVELEREKSDCMALREQLNIRVAHFASSEGREKRMREELEWEIKRLKTLIEAERRDYENRIAIGEDDSEEAQQRHRDELKGLAERLESVESQRDAATSELRLLRGEVDTNEKEFALQRAELVKEVQSLGEQRDSLVKEKRSLQEMHDSLVREKKSLEERHDTLAKEKRSLNEELTRAAKRTSEAETLLLEYRGEKITEKNEREKVKLLMSRLEEHSVALEKKEEETRKQRLALETANEDYNKTLKDLGIKEQTVSSQIASLQDKEQLLGKAREDFVRQRQKDALAIVLNRPIRADREAVSAAFSKWVRVTMFQLAGDNGAKADEVLQQQIEDDRVAFHRREKILEESKRTIVCQLEESKEIESHLRTQLSRLHDEKEKLIEQGASLKATIDASANGKSDRFAPTDDRLKELASLLADRESQVTRKEAVLRQREQKVDGRERHTVAQSEELEDAHGRVRRLADQLRQKERDLEWRETNLTSELSKCENTQSRLQKLATQLQQKAEQLAHDRSLTTRRMEECDALESQLQQWQTRLEVPTSGLQE